MQGVVGVVGCNLYVFATFLVGNYIGLAALLHVDGSGDVVLWQQVVVDALRVDTVFALMVVGDEMLLLGELLDGAYHLLPFGLAARADT